MKQKRIQRRARLKQGGPLRPQSEKQAAKLKAAGMLVPGSTFAVQPAMRVPGKAKQARPADTGPDRHIVDAALERATFCCERCGGGLRPERRGVDWSVHHRKRRSQGLDNSLANLVVLCGGSEADGCHRVVHKEVAAARVEGWLVDRDQDPRLKPIPHVLHGLVFLAVDGSWTTRRPTISSPDNGSEQ